MKRGISFSSLLVGVVACLAGLAGASVNLQEKSRVLEAVGRASLKGRVLYDRKAPPVVEELRPTTSKEKCPESVPGKGWYVHQESKGVGHVLVFLRPPKGFVLPEAEKESKREKRILASVGCQFRPRVLLVKPGDRFEFQNTDQITVDLLLSGPGYFGWKVPPGETKSFDASQHRSDKEPFRVRSGVHSWMSAYVWNLSHPYAVVTDVTGAYEIDDVPIIEGEHQPSLWIWHEMLPGDHFLEIGKLKLEAGKTTVKDISIKD